MEMIKDLCQNGRAKVEFLCSAPFIANNGPLFVFISQSDSLLGSTYNGLPPYVIRSSTMKYQLALI